jgi:hypothetical protein
MIPSDAVPFTASELRELAHHAPNWVRIADDGQIIALVSREDVRVMQARFPTMDPRNADNAPAPNTGNAEAGAIRARYPSMFRSK